MARIVECYFQGLKILLAALLAVMVILVFANVVLRYAFDSGIILSEEISRWLFVWLVFLGAIVGLRENAHVGMYAVIERLTPSSRKRCFIASRLLMLFATSLVIQGSLAQVRINWEVTAPASGLSFGIFYAAGLVFGISASGIVGYELYCSLRGRPHSAL